MLQRSAHRLLLLGLLALLLRGPAPAQTLQLVKDINRFPAGFDADPHPARSISVSQPGDGAARFVRFGGKLYFSSNDAAIGRELHATDGTLANTALVADILPGRGHAAPRALASVRGELWFAAFHTSHGSELYATDGTASGTRLLLDLLPSHPGSDPLGFTELADGRVVFGATTGPLQQSIYVSDGSPKGTARLATFALPAKAYKLACEIVPFPGRKRLLYVSTSPTTGRELWITDGSKAGTQLLKDIVPGPDGSDPEHFVALPSGKLLFNATTKGEGKELWITDGTNAGTRQVLAIYPGETSGAELRTHAILGGSVYFTGHDPVHGRELWRTDGTANGTSLAADIVPGPNSSDPEHLVQAGKRILFAASDLVHGSELWSSDGTAQGHDSRSRHPPWPCVVRDPLHDGQRRRDEDPLLRLRRRRRRRALGFRRQSPRHLQARRPVAPWAARSGRQ